MIRNILTDEEFEELILNIFNRNNCKIPHLENILLWFPDFLYH